MRVQVGGRDELLLIRTQPLAHVPHSPDELELIPSFYRFGIYNYYGYWRYPFLGFYPHGYGYPDDFVSIEVPNKTAFFEGNRCTVWEYIRE